MSSLYYTAKRMPIVAHGHVNYPNIDNSNLTDHIQPMHHIKDIAAGVQKLSKKSIFDRNTICVRVFVTTEYTNVIYGPLSYRLLFKYGKPTTDFVAQIKLFYKYHTRGKHTHIIQNIAHLFCPISALAFSNCNTAIVSFRINSSLFISVGPGVSRKELISR